jgi:hypothetical protein
MKKFVIVLSSMLFITTIVFSQKNIFSIGIGPTVGFAVGNQSYNYYYKNAVGGTVQLNYSVTKLGTITAAASYLSIGAKNQPATKTSFAQIKAGYKTGFLNSGFFAAADAGIAGYNKGLDNFIFSVAAGYSFKLSSSSYIDLFPAYSVIADTPNNNMWLTANALFRFKLQKKK